MTPKTDDVRPRRRPDTRQSSSHGPASTEGARTHEGEERTHRAAAYIAGRCRVVSGDAAEPGGRRLHGEAGVRRARSARRNRQRLDDGRSTSSDHWCHPIAVPIIGFLIGWFSTKYLVAARKARTLAGEVRLLQARAEGLSRGDSTRKGWEFSKEATSYALVKTRTLLNRARRIDGLGPADSRRRSRN